MFRKRTAKSHDVHEKQETNGDREKLENGAELAKPSRRDVLRFQCQLAHGSPTMFVSGFANVAQLYKKIGEEFEFAASDILFCTLNTYKTDMKQLLGGQIGLEDFIFVHKKGRPKEVEVVKTEDSLGLTITDNGAGLAFIKRIKPDSIIDNAKHILVGDHIEKLDGVVMVGKRHFEVARALKNIPLGTTFTIRLIEPLKSGFNIIQPKSTGKLGKMGKVGTGRETLRFKAGGQAQIEQKDDVLDAGIEKINSILESFMGINDEDLATQIWELSVDMGNSLDFAEAVDSSDLASFEFSDDLIIELWGAVTDARDGR